MPMASDWIMIHVFSMQFLVCASRLQKEIRQVIEDLSR